MIVFVHGVLSDFDTAVRNATTNTSWPELLRDDPEVASNDIYLVSYLSPAVSYASNIEQIAQRVSQQLVDQGIFRYQRIYFIAHSMGGLVTKRIVLGFNTPSLVTDLRRIRAVLLISTPANGAPIADIQSYLSLNPQFADMRPADFNTFLQMLEHQWQTVLRERDRSRENYPQTFCAYETLPTGPVIVVSYLYTISYCDNTPYPMDFDHLNVVKPANRDTDPYPWAKARIVDADRLASPQVLAKSLDGLMVKGTGGLRNASLARESHALGDSYWKNAVAGDVITSGSDLKAALVAYEVAEKLDPANPTYPAKIGISHQRLGNYQAAISNLERAVELDPTSAWYRAELCATLTTTGKLSEATPECKTAVKLEPDNVRYRVQLENLTNKGADAYRFKPQ